MTDGKKFLVAFAIAAVAVTSFFGFFLAYSYIAFEVFK